jgi:opacity protein-like surface antigen
MKTYACLLSFLSSVAISTSVFASGADTSAYQGALFNGDSTKFFDTIHSGGPRAISVGAGIEQTKRTMNADNGFKEDYKINHLTGILGVDLTKWLTVYGGAGQADVSTANSDKSSSFEWTAGGTVRALDYMVLEPWNDIDQYWVGLDLNSFYRNTSVDDNWKSENLSEIFGSVTMSFYTRPEKPGIWDRLGFYVGPAVSLLSKGNASEDQLFGFVGGLQLNPNPNMAIRIQFQKFDDVGMGANILFHF